MNTRDPFDVIEPPLSSIAGHKPQRPFKLSLFFLLDHYPERGKTLQVRYQEHLELCVEAERFGFEGVFVAEHHFSNFGAVPNPAILLSAIAARTSRLRLGPAVTILPFRHPMQVVEDYAMVDQISSGRLILGVGSGAVAGEFRGFGLNPDTKRQVFEDRLGIVEQALLGHPGLDGAGSNAPLSNVPTAHGHVPIFLATTKVEGARAAGLGGYGLLTLCSPETPSLDDIVERIEAHAEGLEATTRANPIRESIVTIFAHFADTPGKAREQAAPALERFLHAHGGEGADGYALYDAMVEKGTGAFGTPEQVLERLQILDAAGVDHLNLWMGFGDMESDHLKRALELATQLTQVAPVGVEASLVA